MNPLYVGDSYMFNKYAPVLMRADDNNTIVGGRRTVDSDNLGVQSR